MREEPEDLEFGDRAAPAPEVTPEELRMLPRSVIPQGSEGTFQGKIQHEWKLRAYLHDMAFSLRVGLQRTPELTLGFEENRAKGRERPLDENPLEATDQQHRYLVRHYLRDLAVSLRWIAEARLRAEREAAGLKTNR